MRQPLALLLIGAVLVMGSATSQARVAYADSEIFTLDTITSVDEPASSLPVATRLAPAYPNSFNPSTTIALLRGCTWPPGLPSRAGTLPTRRWSIRS